MSVSLLVLGSQFLYGTRGFIFLLTISRFRYKSEDAGSSVFDDNWGYPLYFKVLCLLLQYQYGCCMRRKIITCLQRVYFLCEPLVTGFAQLSCALPVGISEYPRKVIDAMSGDIRLSHPTMVIASSLE